MFVTMLEPAQRDALLQAASFIAVVDGMSADAERELLRALNMEAGVEELSPVPEDERLLLDTLRQRFADAPVQSRVLLLELAGIAVVDGDVTPAEMALLRNVSATLELSFDRLEEALAFAQDASALANRGRNFLVSDAV